MCLILYDHRQDEEEKKKRKKKKEEETDLRGAGVFLRNDEWYNVEIKKHKRMLKKNVSKEMKSRGSNEDDGGNTKAKGIEARVASLDHLHPTPPPPAVNFLFSVHVRR